MENKNIVFNCTLEQYNKKYRNRRHRLLKYTKKQVEDFDKQYGHYVYNNKTYSLEFNHYLLKERKWALIGDTYYEIPRPVRFTWFRNLSAGVQAISCLVGAGVVASAITVPVVLLNNSGPTITIEGADIDQSASYIELNKDSYIVLKERGSKSIIDVTEVKVDDKAITRETDWTYSNKRVDIKAHAMTSTKIEIKVETKVETAKEKFVRIANEWVIGPKGFCNSTLEYKSTQFKYLYNGAEHSVVNFAYSGTGDNRKLAFIDSGSSRTVASIDYSGDKISNGLQEETISGVAYTFNTNEIIYEYTGAAGFEFKKFSMNNYGYPTCLEYGNGNKLEYVYTGEPKILKNASVDYSKLNSAFPGAIVIQGSSTSSITENKSTLSIDYLNYATVINAHLVAFDKNDETVQDFGTNTFDGSGKMTLGFTGWGNINSGDTIYIGKI